MCEQALVGTLECFIAVGSTGDCFVEGRFNVDVVRFVQFTPGPALADGEYVISVRVIDGLGQRGPAEVLSFAVDTTPPGAPALVAPVDAPARGSFLNNSTPFFDCGASPSTADLEDYVLQVSSGDIARGPFDIEVVITGDATEFQIPTGDALADAVYQWRVIARDRALNTSSSVTRIFTVDTLAPGAPALVTPLDAPVRESFLDTRSPFLKWAPSTGDVFDYRLQVTSGDINTGPFDVDKEILDPTTGDLVVLNGDGTYQWRVIARDLALNTASSVVRSFVVDIVAPAAPELVSPPPLPDAGAFINTGSIFLKWDPSASIGDVFDYRLQATSPGGSFNDPVVIDREIVHPTTGAQITLVTPTGDGVYQWRVIARDRAFNLGTSDTRAFRLDTTPPGVPTLVFPETGDFISDNTPRFDWDASAGDETGNPAVENYILQVVRSGDDFVAGPFVIEATRGRFFTNFQVPAGDELVDDTYRWRVIARDRARNVNTSATRTFTVDTVPPGVPALVAPPTAAVLNTGTPKFEWVPTTLVVETATGNGIRTVFALTRNPIDRDFDDVLTTADVIVEHPVDTVLSTADYTVDHVTDTVTFVVPPGTGGGANNIRFIFAVTGDLARDVFGYVLFVTSGDPFADAFDIQKVITGDPAATVFQVPTGDTLADAGYVWRVVAFDRALNEARSDISGFVVDTVPPGVPTLVAPVAPAFLNTGAVLFDWEDLKGQPQEFRLQVTTADIDTGPFVIDVVIKNGRWDRVPGTSRGCPRRRYLPVARDIHGPGAEHCPIRDRDLHRGYHTSRRSGAGVA